MHSWLGNGMAVDGGRVEADWRLRTRRATEEVRRQHAGLTEEAQPGEAACKINEETEARQGKRMNLWLENDMGVGGGWV